VAPWKSLRASGGRIELANATVEHAVAGVDLQSGPFGGTNGSVIRDSLFRLNDRGIRAQQTFNLRIEANRFEDNLNGVDSSYPYGLRIAGNDFERTANTSIFLFGGQMNYGVFEVMDNLVADGYLGLSAFYVSGLHLQGNTFADNDFLGASLYSAADTSMDGNLFVRNGVPLGGAGLRVTDSSGDPLTATLSVRCNEVQANAAGVQLVATAGALLQRNNFRNNTVQATDDSNAGNAWDNGTVGNFWTDYPGVDADANGIGDMPYEIDLDSVDNFPSMLPFDTASCGAVGTGRRNPVAEAGGPYSGGKNRPVAFDGTASYDPDGGFIASYAWDFGDGGVGSGPTPAHTYTASGTFTATLTVTDDEGQTATDTAPVVIEDLAPTPPIMRAARLVGGGFADVEIEWQLSADDGGLDNDVAGYDIAFGTAYDATGATYALLGTAPAGATSFTHVGGGAGSAVYFYRLYAREDTGRVSAAEVQGGKFARDLGAGDQLVSVPLEQEDWRVDTVFQTVSWSVARTYGKINGHGHNWHSARNPNVWRDLTAVDRTMAVWVEVTAPGTWRVAGLVPAVTQIPLNTGWNFLGYPGFTAKAVGQLLAGINYQTVEGYEDNPPFNLRRLGPADLMYPGSGYWIHVSQDAVLTFTN